MPINMPKNKKTSTPFVYIGYGSFCKIYFKIKVGNFSSGGEKTPKKTSYSFNFSRKVLRSI
ncbi:hypothetical protein C7448_10979 [Tenacibaculum gallaicum]|uniref:Uncharacterized protein n=1 Tax=Tenacibaculum gallaicum TaxID=561505 RepID=A0A3E0HHB0_9FLAO|nr:hypothetical protein C7448_10979 [Tenacibaculum gallaicum]